MSNKMMWSFLIHFGSNMWGKKGAKESYYDFDNIYHDKLFLDRQTWREVTDFLPQCGINTLLIDMGEGVKLDSHPELAVEGSWEKAEFKRELDRLRKMGLTPIPKLNFSGEHNAWLQDWARMLGTERYYQMTQEVIEEVIELFDTPEFFHLGLDGEGRGKIDDTPFTTIRNAPQFTADANKLFKICMDQGVRPWIWMHADDLENQFGGAESFCANIPKEVLISNCYYSGGFGAEQNEKWVGMYNRLAEWGYEQIPCCSTQIEIMNTRQTLKWCRDMEKSQDSIRGFITAPWLLTIPDNIYGLMNGAWVLGAAKEVFYPNECK